MILNYLENDFIKIEMNGILKEIFFRKNESVYPVFLKTTYDFTISFSFISVDTHRKLRELQRIQILHQIRERTYSNSKTNWMESR